MLVHRRVRTASLEEVARAVVATAGKAAGADVIGSMARRAGADIVEVEGSHVIMVSRGWQTYHINGGQQLVFGAQEWSW